MTDLDKAGRRRLVVASALAAVGVALLASFAIAARSGRSATAPGGGSVACANAGEPAAETSAKQLRKSVRCLVNEERAVHGLAKLARIKSLQTASQKHSKVMVKTDCLAHRCPGEVDLETRLRRAGYFEGAKSWRYAENTGCGVSAEAMVDNWMGSSFHRVNILERKYREVGVGVVQGRVKDRCEQDYATFAAVFGERVTSR